MRVHCAEPNCEPSLSVAARPGNFTLLQVLSPIHTETTSAAIQMLQATFDMSSSVYLQVRNAESAGASAAIVYDNIYEALIIMAKPLGNPDPLIPAVFVSQKAGTVMDKLAQNDETYAKILPVCFNPRISFTLPTSPEPVW